MPLGPEVLQSEMNIGDYITRIGTALGIDLDGLVKSPEDKEAEAQRRNQMMQQQQVAEMAKAAAPAVAKEGAAALRDASET